ncbi:hypothetical protein M501DRAFT_1012265 [Patellaria atrata CBS 101060]|uniref:Protein required for cell viability Rrp17 n=1 Tax=Patellaria atrata CBS 101060 TaxID=1346257 RepID=A0A9P4VRF1_9PEZI|nr:hypothetical protein M501DRAFT_1012265 [Patellaria atrata CBS 101060]
MPPPRKRLKPLPKAQKVESIDFDDTARQDWLSGFHKRKVARISRAQEEAAKRERKERVRERRELREQRKADLEKHVEEVEALLKKAVGVEDEEEDEEEEGGDGEEWDGFQEPEIVDREEEYVDEDKFATVTIEAVDITREGFRKVGNGGDGEDDTEDEDEDGIPKTTEKGDKASGKKREWTKERPKAEKPKMKKKKFRYESKAERQVTRFKQREKNRKQAQARRG